MSGYNMYGTHECPHWAQAVVYNNEYSPENMTGGGGGGGGGDRQCDGLLRRRLRVSPISGYPYLDCGNLRLQFEPHLAGKPPTVSYCIQAVAASLY